MVVDKVVHQLEEKASELQDILKISDEESWKLACQCSESCLNDVAVATFKNRHQGLQIHDVEHPKVGEWYWTVLQGPLISEKKWENDQGDYSNQSHHNVLKTWDEAKEVYDKIVEAGDHLMANNHRLYRQEALMSAWIEFFNYGDFSVTADNPED